ncbi:MAG: hypothetical protein JW778_01075 [Candidatus Altiarchaeota archaeon]|nr:hypothetical protein [Candidatus Altiarchaeota archaeon]
MNDKSWILAAFILFISMNSAVSATKCRDPCFGSPSNACVVDDTDTTILEYCAVGCEIYPGPTGGAYCTFGPFMCTTYATFGSYMCKDGSTPSVRCSVAKLVSEPDSSDCMLECAAACGRKTLLTDNCEQCTATDVCSIYAAGSKTEEACYHTCYGVCESNRQFCNVIDLLRYGAMFAGIIMLILHGFRWITSEDLEARRDARKGVEYVLAGFILIVVASTLVELIFLHTIIC